MKILSLLMCFYVCLLLTVPCQDHGIQTGVAGHMEGDASGQHHHDEGACHTCSPFCTCSCCHVQAITSIFVISGLPSDIVIPALSVSEENTSEGVPFSVWQPPKFC